MQFPLSHPSTARSSGGPAGAQSQPVVSRAVLILLAVAIMGVIATRSPSGAAATVLLTDSLRFQVVDEVSGSSNPRYTFGTRLTAALRASPLARQ